MKTKLKTSLCCAFLALAATVFADTFTHQFGAGMSMDFVGIGNAGNSGTQFDWGSIHYTDLGAVGYNYGIGKYEVTEGQWAAYANDPNPGTRWSPPRPTDDGLDTVNSWGGANKPKIQVNWYEAAHYCNWLTTGNSEQGAYQFNGANGAFSGMDRTTALAQNSTVYVLPSIDEWYKAAYYRPDNSGFSEYANGTSSPPDHGVDANLDSALTGWPAWDAGSGTEEQNGTFDMMGNVWEWTETAADGSFDGVNEQLQIEAGSAHGPDYAQFDKTLTYAADNATSWLGFRVASLGNYAIPEPSSVVMIALIGGGAVFVRRWFVS